MERSHRVTNYFRVLGERIGAAGAIGELVVLLRNSTIDQPSIRALIERHGVAHEPRFRNDCLDLILSFISSHLHERYLDKGIESDEAPALLVEKEKALLPLFNMATAQYRTLGAIL